MHVLQLIDSLSIGGAERMSVNIGNALQENGHHVILIATRKDGPLTKMLSKGVVFRSLEKKSAIDVFAFLRFITILYKERIEIIHAHSSSIYWAILGKVFKPRMKIIWHDHYGFSEILKDSDRKLIKYISPLFYGVIVVNTNLENWALRNIKVTKEKIVFLNNFPVLPKFTPKKEEEELTIVCIANLRLQKDHPTLVKALKKLKNQTTKKFRLILAGKFYNDDYYQEVCGLIEELELQEVINIAGPIDNTAELLAIADIGILSSISEGLSVSLLEYGLAKLAVVVTNVGQCSEVVLHGKAGLVVQPKDENAIADALLKYIDDPELISDMGEKLYTNVLENYSSEAFLKAYYKLLDVYEDK